MSNVEPHKRLLDGDVALVVGGGRGIGAATAVLLGRVGASVAIAARTNSEVTRVSELVSAEGSEAMSCAVDVRSSEQVERMVDQVHRRFGRLDHVVYCAGYLPDAAFVWNVDPDQLQVAFEVNVLGPVFVARTVVPALREQGTGNLVFVTSALPDWPIPGLGAYTASRAAENTLVQTMAAELRGSGVRVDCFTPPPTETSALRQFRAGLAGRRAAADAIEAKDPADVAQWIVWLCLPAWKRAAEQSRSLAGYVPPVHRGGRPGWMHSW